MRYTQYISIILVMCMLLIYAIMGAFIEAKRPIIGNEMSVIILVGTAISFIVYNLQSKEAGDILILYQSAIVNACLPLIIFSKGFNMKRKKIFKNSANIIKFGLIGTLLLFFVMTAINTVIFKIVDLGHGPDQ